MPSWGEVFAEFRASGEARGGSPDSDGIRLKYIHRLRELTGRPVIVYASGWLTKSGSENVGFSIEGSDVLALMEVCNQVDERELDLIIHSPGGSPMAAEQMLNYLRTQFDRIRVFVPLQAKSAATMIALGCDEIVMGRHSELGPIDPQILVSVPEGVRYAPALAILRDFQRAKAEIKDDVNVLGAWTPILRGYAGGLIEFCWQQVHLAQEVVAGWLDRYMLATVEARVDASDRKATAKAIADFFGSEASYDRFRTHGRPIRIEELQQIRGLVVRPLEADDAIQDAVLSIYHALDHTFSLLPAIKIVENHRGARYVRLFQEVVISQKLVPAPQRGRPPAVNPLRPSSTPSRPNRAQRRRAGKRP